MRWWRAPPLSVAGWEVWNLRIRVVRPMTDVLLRLLGPTAYLSAAVVLAWSSALVGELVGDAGPAPLVPIPWVGS